MTQFFALLRLQLLSRYADLKPKNIRTALREKKGRTVGKLIGIIVLVLYLGGLLFFVETKLIDLLTKMNMPEMLVTLAVFISMAGTLIMAFFFIMGSLFLGRDAVILASMPIKTRTLLSAKLAQIWLSETAIDALILLPACLLYGIRTGAEAMFYVRLIPVWLLISVLPVSLISFVSMLLIRLTALWRHREQLATVFGILFMVLYMYVCMNIGSITGDDSGELLQSFVVNYSARIDAMAQLFPPAGWAIRGLMGDLGQLALFVGVSLAAAALTLWIVGIFYRKLSLLQAETPAAKAGKKNGTTRFTTGSALKACCLREIRSILRVPSYSTNILPIAFMPTLLIIMMGFAFNRNVGENEQGLAQFLAGLDKRLVMAILSAVMCYMGGLNTGLSTAVSREGKGHAWLTALPIPGHTLILAKMIVGYGLSFIGVLTACIALYVLFPVFLPQIVMGFALTLLFSFLNDCLALDRDIRKPKLDWVTEQEAVKQNYGALINMLLSWGMLGALGGLTYLLITWDLSLTLIFVILAALLAIGCVLAWIKMMHSADKYYCVN